MKKYVLISEVEYRQLTKPIEKLEEALPEVKVEIPESTREPEVEKPSPQPIVANDRAEEIADKTIQKGKGNKRRVKQDEVNVVKKRWKKLL